MAEVCREIDEWIEEETEKPVTKWVEKQEKKCKKKKCKKWCLCCNKWFCWIATFLVKVVTWIVVKVGKWVTRTVCEIINIVVGLVVDIVGGLIDILVGIFTWNWAKVWDGLVKIFGGLIEAAFGLFRIAALGDLIDYIRDEINTYRLRKYVKKLLQEKYDGDRLEQLIEALGVDHGAFGFRVAAKALRTYVRSDYMTEDGSPALYQWHNDSSLNIDLYEMAGYEYSEFFRRFRPEVKADSGGFSKKDLDNYLNSKGMKGKAFSIYCMSKSVLKTKLRSAREKGGEIGLLFKWSTGDIQVKKPEYVRHDGFDTGHATASLETFLVDPAIAGRKKKSVDELGARNDLCLVIGAGIFFYTDSLNGLSAHLYTSKCLDGSDFKGDDVSGVTFRDRLPDIVWKYVPIHEIGHYFGLCHVDGLDRIMFGPRDHSAWSWWLLPEYIYLSGEPVFTFDEGKKVWDYIVANFNYECLAHRAD